jgi:3,4-dihydroxyphenylacetate 2,3-dioxygenase
MGELVFAAKVTHVPTMLISLKDGPLKGTRKNAIDGHVEIGRRMRAAGATTVAVVDTH